MKNQAYIELALGEIDKLDELNHDSKVQRVAVKAFVYALIAIAKSIYDLVDATNTQTRISNPPRPHG